MMPEETSFVWFLPVTMVTLPSLIVIMNMINVVWHNWGHVGIMCEGTECMVWYR